MLKLLLLLGLLPQAFAASAVVYWNPSVDNPGGSGLDHYNVYRGGTKIGSTTTTGYLDSTVSDNTTYTYTVTAVDKVGNESAQSSGFTTRVGSPSQNVTCSGDITSALGTAISNAADGDTITVSTGSCSWTSFVNFSNTKGVTLKCATSGACNISASNAIGLNGTLSGTNSKLYRITGFNITQTAGFSIWFWGNGTLQQVRIDHNTFTYNTGSATVIQWGESTSLGAFYGVIDHNTFTSTSSIAAQQYISTNWSTPAARSTGLLNNIFFEDNTVSITTMTDDGTGCMDAQGPFGTVWRHNATTNCLVTSHGVTHEGGPQVIELYSNHFTVNSGVSGFPSWQDCTRCFHHQGSGEFYAFNNTFTPFSGHSTGPISMLHYCSYANCIDGVDGPICDGNNTAARPDGGKDGNRTPQATYQGYPCWHQPGRDFAVTPQGGNLFPNYSWNNTYTDNGAIAPYVWEDFGGSPDYYAQHTVANRDYFTAVSVNAQSSPTSPFNGTTGMGFGTLANRPTTCSTANTDAADAGSGGVGYFATDVGAQGTLYACHSTNTWAVQYVPYTYPHPLTLQP